MRRPAPIPLPTCCSHQDRSTDRFLQELCSARLLSWYYFAPWWENIFGTKGSGRRRSVTRGGSDRILVEHKGVDVNTCAGRPLASQSDRVWYRIASSTATTHPLEMPIRMKRCVCEVHGNGGHGCLHVPPCSRAMSKLSPLASANGWWETFLKLVIDLLESCMQCIASSTHCTMQHAPDFQAERDGYERFWGVVCMCEFALMKCAGNHL